MDKENAVAVLTIKKAGSFTEQGAKDVAAWLRWQAENLEQHGKQYASRYRARFIGVKG